MAAAEQAIQVVMQIATRGADRRQITKDDQQRLCERLPPRSDRGLAAAAVQSARSHCHARRRRIVARRHGAVGSSCKMPSPSQRASMPAGKVHACRRQCSKSLTVLHLPLLNAENHRPRPCAGSASAHPAPDKPRAAAAGPPDRGHAAGRYSVFPPMPSAADNVRRSSGYGR